MVEMGVRLPARFGQAVRQPRVGRQPGAIRRSIGRTGRSGSACAAVALAPLVPLAPGPTPPDSPTNGIA